MGSWCQDESVQTNLWKWPSSFISFLLYFPVTFPQLTYPRGPNPFVLCLVTSLQLSVFVKLVHKLSEPSLSVHLHFFSTRGLMACKDINLKCLITLPFIAAFPSLSYLPIPLAVFTGLTFQMNSLYLDCCLRVYFSKSPNWNREDSLFIHSNIFVHPLDTRYYLRVQEWTNEVKIPPLSGIIVNTIIK